MDEYFLYTRKIQHKYVLTEDFDKNIKFKPYISIK